MVDPVRRGSRLLHDDGRDRQDRERHGSGESEVHDRAREAPRNPDPAQAADDRVQQERDQSGDHEEEDRVTDDARYRPHEEEQERQSYELDPARNLDPRLRGRHASERIALVVTLRPPDWEWTAWEEGALALDRLDLHQLPEQAKGAPVSQSRA